VNKVLFLDIDGVLNGHRLQENNYCTIEPELVKRLNLILKSVPDLQIVISSAWRYLISNRYMTLKGFEVMMLTHGLISHGRIVGHTRNDTEASEYRISQIMDYVKEHNVKKWLAIDDLDIDIIPHPNHVKTDGFIGIQDEHVETIIRYFED
jgi:hypothetical protein